MGNWSCSSPVWGAGMIPRLEKQEGQSASEVACSGGSEILSVACPLERLDSTDWLNAAMISAWPIRAPTSTIQHHPDPLAAHRWCCLAECMSRHGRLPRFSRRFCAQAPRLPQCQPSYATGLARLSIFQPRVGRTRIGLKPCCSTYMHELLDCATTTPPRPWAHGFWTVERQTTRRASNRAIVLRLRTPVFRLFPRLQSRPRTNKYISPPRLPSS